MTGKRLVQQPDPEVRENVPVVTGEETRETIPAPSEPQEPPEPDHGDLPGIEDGKPFYKAVLDDPASVEQSVLDATYKRTTLLRARLVSEIREIDASMEEMRVIALRKKGERPGCFGQYDGSPNCNETCRDPVCPDYTAQTRGARDKARMDAAQKAAESIGRTTDEFTPHQPVELADGTVIIGGE